MWIAKDRITKMILFCVAIYANEFGFAQNMPIHCFFQYNFVCARRKIKNNVQRIQLEKIAVSTGWRAWACVSGFI